MSFKGVSKKFGVIAGLIAISLLIASSAMAGITGKISGQVKDKKTGDALPGVNIVVEGTTMGAATDADGRYIIVNVRPGDYSLMASIIGYQKMRITNVRVTADLTSTNDFELAEEVLEGEVMVITGERPLVQRDQTASVRVTSSEEIQNLPVRDYKEVVGATAGVVKFESNGGASAGGRGGTAASASNLPQLNVRGGRANQIGYIVDGASVQDPITGNTTMSITPDAIDEVMIMTGGFNAEYGRIMSGAINVTTKRGQKSYHGKVGAVTDNLGLGSEPMDYNVYDFSLSGPVIPGNDKINFFFSGSRTWQGSRTARSNVPEEYFDSILSTDMVTLANGSEIPSLKATYESALDKLSKGVLPYNFSDSWSWSGKLGFDISSTLKFDLGFLGSSDDFIDYSHASLFNGQHNAYYEDRNSAVNAKLTYQMNKTTFFTVGANYFATERFRGDGVYKQNMMAYGRPNGVPNFDRTALFSSWDDISGPTEHEFRNFGWTSDALSELGYSGAAPDSVSFLFAGDESNVFTDYFQRKSSYVGFDFDITSQIHPSHEIKAGFDIQKHKMRYYRNLFPERSYRFLDDPGFAGLDVDQYGYRYDPIANELVEDDDPTGNGLDGPKEPTTFAFYLQDKIEYEGIVINFGVRYDFVNPETKQLVDPNDPLNADPTGSSSALEDSEVEDSEAQTAFSPRLGIGFPITDRTVLTANYGWFYQQPNLFDMYVGYGYLEHKVRTGGYYYAFGNPNLEWEKTTAYEVGLRHQLSESAVFEATAYYKSIEDLVQVRQIYSTPSSHASYRNTDYGTTKGFDFSYSSRRVNNLSFNLSYSLSWATGTGSSSQSTRNIAWTGEEPPRQTSALEFDQRHKFTFNTDYRYSNNAPISLLNNFGVNLLGSMASGTPYTPQKVYNEMTLGSVSAEPVGAINSRYGPWIFRIDMKANKALNLAGVDLNFYVWVLNLLNRENAVYVWESSGDPQSTSFMSTDQGQELINNPASRVPHDSSGLTAEQKFLLKERDPRNFDIARTVRFGVDLSF